MGVLIQSQRLTEIREDFSKEIKEVQKSVNKSK